MILDDLSRDQITAYLRFLEKKYETWQVDQAKKAINLFVYFKTSAQSVSEPRNVEKDQSWKMVIEQMVTLMRLKHMAFRTEKTYVGWMRSFVTSRQVSTLRLLS